MSVKSKTWTCKSIWRGRLLSQKLLLNGRLRAKCQTHPKSLMWTLLLYSCGSTLQASTSGKLLSPCNLVAGMHKNCTSASKPDVIRQTYEHFDVGVLLQKGKSKSKAFQWHQNIRKAVSDHASIGWVACESVPRGCVMYARVINCAFFMAVWSWVWTTGQWVWLHIIWTLPQEAEIHCRTFVCYWKQKLEQNGNIPHDSPVFYLPVSFLITDSERTNQHR